MLLEMVKRPCVEIAVNENYNVMVITRNDVYDCYIMHRIGSNETPFFHMFGLPCDHTTYEEACKIAIANAPEYYNTFVFTENIQKEMRYPQ